MNSWLHLSLLSWELESENLGGVEWGGAGVGSLDWSVSRAYLQACKEDIQCLFLMLKFSWVLLFFFSKQDLQYRAYQASVFVTV